MENTETLTESYKRTPITKDFSLDKQNLSLITVVKRNGSLVPFRRERIASAIESAFRATKNIEITASIPQELFSEIQKVADAVVIEAVNQAKIGACLTVEGIQDLVEVKLMDTGHYDVARNFIAYREERKEEREDSPRNIKILKRDGKKFVRFNPMKIASAIESTFRDARGIQDTTPTDVIDAVNFVTSKVVNRVVELNKAGTTLQVELIQDEVERQLMGSGYFDEAKAFILFRAKRAQIRELKKDTEVESVDHGREFNVVDANGTPTKLTEKFLRDKVFYAAEGLDNVNPEEVLQDAIRNFYEGIKITEVEQALILASRAKVEQEPNYSFMTAKILIDCIYRETFETAAHDTDINNKHAEYFKKYIDKGILLGRLDPKLKEFDINKIANAIDLRRDALFTYLGIQTIYDRYLIHHDDVKVETPQAFWMRVSMGLALLEGENKTAKAIEFYDVLSQFYMVSSTPTLFNSGTTHSQMSSCYLLTVYDDLHHIFKTIADDAQLSKWAGGLGNDWTNVRATGSRIKGTNGRSQGVVPFLKVANDTAVAVNQGGKRKGAMCAYLESWHLDIEDFLELRKNTGDERRRTHDMNTANWIPDLFMKRVKANGAWTLFDPSDVKDLHDLYGSAFETRYEEYERMVDSGEIKLFKRVEAVALWRKMLSMLFETGHPWITFKDPSNVRSPQDHVGVVHSSNLCTEILLNTSKDETAVCNLGSINLAKHVTSQGIDEQQLARTVKTAIRMLDNVIDINFYPTEEAKNSNLRHRPIGLGLMGFQDCLYEMNISYASNEAVDFSDKSMEMISYYAILASCELAKERGAYQSYKGSKWDRGMLPIDTLNLLEEERGSEFVDVNKDTTMDWNKVRAEIKKYGMRNSNTMAIAPTATISNISGVTQSIEPAYKHLFAKSNLSGEFIIVNQYLVNKLKSLNLWDEEMIDDLKYYDGSILEIDRIPEEVKQVFLTSFEIEPDWMIECASRRQKWIDMGQSLNLYMAEPSGKKLNDMYMQAWEKGLKTTYYLRCLGATQIEKSTTDINKRGVQPRWMKNKSASSEVIKQEKPKADMPKACNLDGDCESCQ